MIKYEFTTDKAFDYYGGELSKGSAHSAGADLRAIEFMHGGKIGTGIKFQIPENHVGLVYVRSSIGFKHGYCLANGTGIIDSDYRGEIFVQLAKVDPVGGFSEIAEDCQKCHSVKMPSLELLKGERFAQLVVVPCDNVFEWGPVDETDRGSKGIGSSGRK